MNILIIILLAFASILILLLLLALFMNRQYNIHSEIIIDAPILKVFDYLKQLKNQDNFNKWVMADPDMKKTFKGTDGTIGFVYAWKGNKKAGEGEQEIKNIVDRKNIETEIRFIKPFVGIAYANMVTESISNEQTKVTWSNASTIKYPLNIMLPMMEKMLLKDMDTSLKTLKNILEK